MGLDLCFQVFDGELAGLPGLYTEPSGALLSAFDDGALTGCRALRPLDTVDYANACEMKRPFVRPRFRGLGIGRLLAEAALDSARQAGCAYVLLNKLTDMEAARALYEDLRFEQTPPYCHNPISGSHCLKVKL